MITGFRVARGGAQELYGVLPDLTIMGKIIGGGLPAAAYGGPRELMERIAPAGDVYQAGTLSGNPLAVAAALATLARLDAAAYERLAATTEALADGLREAAARGRRARSRSRAVPGLLTVFFTDAAGRTTTPAPRPATSTPTAPGAGRCWRAGSTRRPRSSRPGSRRWPTSAEHVARTVEAAAEAFAEVARDEALRDGAAPDGALRAHGGTLAERRSRDADGRASARRRPGPRPARGRRARGPRAARPSTSCCWR